MFVDLSVPKEKRRKNIDLLPNSIRACIVGKSGCGKTNLLLNLLLGDYLDYNHLYLFSRSLHQPEYQALIKGFENKVPKHLIGEAMRCKLGPDKVGNGMSPIELTYGNRVGEIPDPLDLDVNQNNLMVFDDLMLEKQNKCEDYYTRGRHNNIDCFYISQNYTKLPRNTIRENSNLFILFPQDQITLDNFHRDHCTDLNKSEFNSVCREAWREPYNFVTIDLTSGLENGRYRKNLDEFYFVRLV